MRRHKRRLPHGKKIALEAQQVGLTGVHIDESKRNDVSSRQVTKQARIFFAAPACNICLSVGVQSQTILAQSPEGTNQHCRNVSRRRTILLGTIHSSLFSEEHLDDYQTYPFESLSMHRTNSNRDKPNATRQACRGKCPPSKRPGGHRTGFSYVVQNARAKQEHSGV